MEHSSLSLFCQLVWSLVCLIEDLSLKQSLVDRERSHVFVVLVRIALVFMRTFDCAVGAGLGSTSYTGFSFHFQFPNKKTKYFE